MIESAPHGDFTAYCDECGTEETFRCDDNWDLLMEKMKESEWARKKINNEWNHFCPFCK